jgi:hypothetical protein
MQLQSRFIVEFPPQDIRGFLGKSVPWNEQFLGLYISARKFANPACRSPVIE